MSTESPEGKTSNDSTASESNKWRYNADVARGTLDGEIAGARIFQEDAGGGHFEMLPVERGLVEIVARAEQGDNSIAATLSLPPGEARRLGQHLIELAGEAERQRE